MRLILITISMFLSIISVSAQSSKFEKGMQAAIQIHDMSQTFADEMKAVTAFEKLAKGNPKEWLPAYWASYVCTQIARLDGKIADFPKDSSGSMFMQKAQNFLDMATKAKVKTNDKIESDFHALQSFIYLLNSGTSFSADKTKSVEYWDSLKVKEEKLAIQLNPDNINLQIQFSLDKISKIDATYKELMVSIAVLNYCESEVNKNPNRGMTTYWAKDFINFWRSRAKSDLKKLLETADSDKTGVSLFHKEAAISPNLN